MGDDKQMGIKHDQNKTEYHYLSPIALEELCKVLTFGAKKYESHNWCKGFKWSRVISAALRHIFAWLGGQTNDTETGLNHLAHAMSCLMFLLEFSFTHKELDDRYKCPTSTCPLTDKVVKNALQRADMEGQRLSDLLAREITVGCYVKDRDSEIYQVQSIIGPYFTTTYGQTKDLKEVEFYKKA